MLTSPPGGRAGVDDHDVGEHRLELADPGLHLSLRILGCVVVAVLGQVAQGPGGLDGAGDVDAAAGAQVFELGLQPVEGVLGEFGRSHGDQGSLPSLATRIAVAVDGIGGHRRNC